MRTVDTGSWLGRTFQGQGFGKEMRAAVLGFAFDGLGARVAETKAFLDNAASNGVSRALGYEENGRGSLAPKGVARETQRFRMTIEGWRSRPRPPLTIEGLDVSRAMFGAEVAAGRLMRAAVDWPARCLISGARERLVCLMRVDGIRGARSTCVSALTALRDPTATEVCRLRA